MASTTHRIWSLVTGPWPLALLAALALVNAPVIQGLVLLGLGAWWAARWVRGRVPGPVLTGAGAAGALVLMALVGLLIAPDWRVSLPKLTGLLLDLTIAAAAFWALGRRTMDDGRRTMDDGRRTMDEEHQHSLLATRYSLLATLLAGLGGVLALATPFTADFAGKVSSLLPRGWAVGLPDLLAGVTRDSFGNVQGGIHANELGGTLALLLPFALAGALAGVGDWGLGVGRSPYALRITHYALRITVLLMGAALLLLGSRSGLLGALAGVGGVVWWGRPRWRVGYLVGAGVVLGAGLALALTRPADPAGMETVSFRLELWARTLAMLQGAPFTGVGLNSFPVVQADLYPILYHEATGFVPHAHNLYLQTAADYGVPGLVAFVALLAGLVGAARRGLKSSVAEEDAGFTTQETKEEEKLNKKLFHNFLFNFSRERRAAQPVSPLLLGAIGGLAAWCTHGLVDAITIGAKPVVLVGLCAGIILAHDPAPALLRRRDLPRRAVAWVLLTLIAIGLLEILEL